MSTVTIFFLKQSLQTKNVSECDLRLSSSLLHCHTPFLSPLCTSLLPFYLPSHPYITIHFTLRLLLLLPSVSYTCYDYLSFAPCLPILSFHPPLLPSLSSLLSLSASLQPFLHMYQSEAGSEKIHVSETLHTVGLITL